MTDLLILEDRVINGLLGDPRVQNLVPCLASVAKNYAKNKVDCGRCKVKARQVVTNTTAAAKQCIASLSSASKIALKQLINARQLRLTYRNSSGKLVQLTF